MNILERLRIDRGLSMRDLSRETGVSTRTITRLENGEKAITLTLAKLAKALGVEVDVLLELSETPTPNPKQLKPIKVEPELLAELSRRAALPDSEFLTEAESEAESEALLDKLEREYSQQLATAS